MKPERPDTPGGPHTVAAPDGPYGDQYDEHDGIAIVGMSGRFPGARDLAAFWRNTLSEADSISHFAADALEPSFREDMLARSDPGYVRARGVLDDVECFDEAFFGFTPAEAALLDPQHRLFLQACWEALEHAGHDPDSFDGLVGVFAGGTANSYYLTHLQSRPDVTDKLGLLTTQMANQGHYIATRAAYKLNLRGPALNIHTACSTSLVAVCTAVQSLQSHQCDMALAGGVSITLPQRRGYLHQEGSILSPDGVCRAFDEHAAGTVFSNGLGVVVLRRLSDALQDGNTIYAVIKGAALNNDGHDKLSFTAPSIHGQAEVISFAQAAGGIDPQTIGYVEAHGTGTQLGDPIELAALTQAFRAGGDKRRGACALASVKTQIGHLDAAAGVTGLIRAALALHHRTLPATLHFASPNPKLGLEDSPFYVNRHVCPWPEGPVPRRAGVSSFGVGGTNAHVVLEEAPRPKTQGHAPRRDPSEQPEQTPSRPQLLVVSARDEAALARAMANLARAFAEQVSPLPAEAWADVAYTLQSGRRAFPWRSAFVSSGPSEAMRQITVTPPPAVQARDRLRVAFMFPGQGSQQINAGRGLYASEPVFRSEIDECAAVLRGPLGLDLRDVMFPLQGEEAAARERLSQTAYAQPALLVLQLALARLWAHWGVSPAVVLGHSVGEFAAACLAGTFKRHDALLLVAERGRLMQELQPGAMLAVRAAPEELALELAEGVDLAAANGPRSTVLAGPVEVVARVESQLEARGLGCRVLPSSRAFHSAMMEPAMAAFERHLESVPRRPPQLPWISTLTGRLITAEEALSANYWSRQLRAPVQFSQAVETCLSLCDATLEVGSGDTLTRLVQQQTGARGLAALVTSLPARPQPMPEAAGAGEPSLSDELADLLQSAGRLWCAGAPLAWSVIQSGDRRRVPLPTYPFAPNRHWIEPAPLGTSIMAIDGAAAKALKPNQESTVVDSGAPGHSAQPAVELSRAEVSDVPAQAAAADRRGALIAQLQTLFADLAGVDAQSLDPAVNLLEWGLDSLILTQASQTLKKSLGVKVPMRALLEDLSTLNALADHVLPLLPAPEPVPAQAPPAAARHEQISPATSHGATTGPPVGLHDWLALFSQQLALMNQQLQVLREGGSVQAAGAVPSLGLSGTAVAPESRDSGHESKLSQLPAVAAASGSAAPAFGPFRPPQRVAHGSAAASLSPAQQAALDDFIARYNARTQSSKAQTQINRQHLADPRSVAGYRQLLKELIYPIVTVRSEGSRLWDVDGNGYVDITNGFGMILFGHNPPFIREALRAQIDAGYEIGPQSPLAAQVAQAVCVMVGLERAAFCATGSEAVMAAIRVARTVTGRDRVVMFSGAYHGIFDEVLVRPARVGSAASERATSEPGRAVPIAPGIPSAMADNIVVLEYGTAESLRIIEAMGSTVAAVLVEPVQSRRPDLQPTAFLQSLRKLTADAGSALIFDEVVTGFRCHPAGAQAWFGVRADLATYGKVLGGGLPIGVVAGSARFMDALDGGAWQYGDASAPEVGVTFFAGTFVRHPLALAAARAVLAHLKDVGPVLQQRLNERTSQLVADLQSEIDAVGVPLKVLHFSSWFHFQWTADLPLAALFYAAMRMRGIHIWEGRPSFITTAHSESDLAEIVKALRDSLCELQSLGLFPGSASLGPSKTSAAAVDAAQPPSARNPQQPPVPGARKGRDVQGREAWFVPDPERPGKFLQVHEGRTRHG